MSETRRKKPGSLNLDKLNGMFMPKGGAEEAHEAAETAEESEAPAPAAPPPAARPARAERPQRAAAPVEEGELVRRHVIPVVETSTDDLIITTIRYPRYIAHAMEEWLSKNPGHSKTSLILNGLYSLGLPIEEEDLLPKRPRGTFRG